MIMAAATVSCAGDKEPFPVPEKPILEMDYTAEKTTFEVWAPTAEGVVVRLYDGDTLSEEIAMERAEAGLWRAVAEGDHKGEYYAFAVTVDGKLSAHYENTVLITDGEPEILTVAEGL